MTNIQFDADQVREIVEESKAFVKEMAGLLKHNSSTLKRLGVTRVEKWGLLLLHVR